MKTQTFDLKTFLADGKLVETTPTASSGPQKAFYSAAVIVAGVTATNTAYAAEDNLKNAFDPIIKMLQDLAFPVAMTVLAWACLQAMIGKPAMAVDRAKWAIVGYLAMRYMPELLRHV